VSPRSAKTHKGAWALFGYQAAGATPEEAEATVAAAERFVNAIDDLFD
jgi:hypothetical protein